MCEVPLRALVVRTASHALDGVFLFRKKKGTYQCALQMNVPIVGFGGERDRESQFLIVLVFMCLLTQATMLRHEYKHNMCWCVCYYERTSKKFNDTVPRMLRTTSSH